MNPVNSLVIEGNLVRDPILSETPKGTKVCNFTVASNHYYKRGDNTQNDVTFLDIEAWTNLASFVGKNMNKGNGVRVVGRLKQDRWEDPEGKPHSRMKLIASYLEPRPTLSKESYKLEENKTQEVAEASVI